jgi:transcriptional regulator with XRE-family HTH domain
MNFAKRLTEIRELKRLSQTSLAIIAKVTPSAICQFEKGQRSPNLKVLVRLCDALEIGIDDLLQRNTRTTFIVCDRCCGIGLLRVNKS